MSFKRTQHKDEAYVNLGFRGRGILANAIEAAAEKGKAPSMAAWLKGVVSEAVAKTLGVPVSSLEYREEGSIRDLDELERLDTEIAAAKAVRERLAARLGHTKSSRRR